VAPPLQTTLVVQEMEPGVDGALVGGIVGGIVGLCLIVLLIALLVARRKRSAPPPAERASLGAATEASVGNYASTSEFRQGVAHSQVVVYDELPSLDN